MGLKNWIRNWLKEDDTRATLIKEGSISPSLYPVQDMDSHNGLNITLYTANGGHVVSIRRYDTRADRSHNQLYLITSDQNFEEALAQCIAMEKLSR